jgi:hypothetical protein
MLNLSSSKHAPATLENGHWFQIFSATEEWSSRLVRPPRRLLDKQHATSQSKPLDPGMKLKAALDPGETRMTR